MKTLKKNQTVHRTKSGATITHKLWDGTPDEYWGGPVVLSLKRLWDEEARKINAEIRASEEGQAADSSDRETNEE